jgi:pyrophosphatase PpaX
MTRSADAPTAVLWDLDDTLLDTLSHRMRSLDHAYSECLGEKTDPEALWRSHRGATLEALGQRLLRDDFRRFVDTYRDHYYGESRKITAYRGVEDVLAACLEAGLRMAVVTSKVSWGATEELNQAGLLRYFDAVVGSDDTDSHKPNPEPLFMALERMLIEPGDGITMVGDSPADMLAARNAGVRSVAATWGTLDLELLLDTGPDLIADTPAAVQKLLFPVAVAK